MQQLLFPFLFLTTPSYSTNHPVPKILSALYGYDGCIGGVNSFSTEEEYLQELKRRNCTVVEGPGAVTEVTNVVSSTRLNIGCLQPFARLEWLDGIPVTFSLPLSSSPPRTAFQVHLTDNSVSIPECAVMAPANEANELDTVLLLGRFGDGLADTVWPSRVEVVEDLHFAGFEGEVKASSGLVFSSENDLRYTLSSVRMVFARMWDVNKFEEGSSYPTWPLPSSTYPNNCQHLFPSTSHIIRVAFSGGVTRDGVTSLTPDSTDIFSVHTAQTATEVGQLGLADLGNTLRAPDGQAYVQDGDNIIDICLDMGEMGGVLQEDFVLTIHCKGESRLYPPKGKPFSCVPDQVLLTAEEGWGNFMKAWIHTSDHSSAQYCPAS